MRRRPPPSGVSADSVPRVGGMVATRNVARTAGAVDRRPNTVPTDWPTTSLPHPLSHPRLMLLSHWPKHILCSARWSHDLLGFCRERPNFGAQPVRLRQHRITFHVQTSTVVGGCKSMYIGIVHTSRGRGRSALGRLITTSKQPAKLGRMGQLSANSKHFFQNSVPSFI